MVENRSIPLYCVHMPDNIAEVLKPVLLSGFISEGPQAKKFEEEFQKYVGNPYTALVDSCTSALTLALRMSGVGPGTEVISSPLTCVATNSPVLTLGADIVWCDVDIKTGNIDADKIEALITSKTKAILFVDWAGTPAELDKINAVAKKYNLKTIEDAAHAIGSSYKGRSTGTSCSFTCFSFQCIKHFTTIKGGALACSNEEDYKRAVLLRWFGLKRAHKKSPVCWEGDITEPGYKMHFDDVSATIGLEQLKYIDGIVEKHRENGNFLLRELDDVEGIDICSVPDYVASSFWFFTILLEGPEHREYVNKKLEEKGISSNITHTRNDSYSMFDDSKVYLPGLDSFSSRMLNIPCGWWCEPSDMKYIIDTLRKIV